MTFDLYAWKSPRDLDADGAAALVQRWHDDGADPAASPFEPSEDVGWFHRELTRDEPDLDVVSDAVPNASTRPVWLASDRAPPARLVAIRLTPDTTREAVNDILSLVVKYDLVLFDARAHRVHLPLAEMTARASSSFWPGGAVQAAVAGGVGLLLAMVGRYLPIVGWILIIVGGFLVVMAVFTFVQACRTALRARGSRGDTPPG